MNSFAECLRQVSWVNEVISIRRTAVNHLSCGWISSLNLPLRGRGLLNMFWTGRTVVLMIKSIFPFKVIVGFVRTTLPCSTQIFNVVFIFSDPKRLGQ